MPSLLITGAAGMLGCDTVTTLQPAYKLLPFSHDALDVTDSAAVEDCFRQHQPDSVLHLAALTNVDRCQTEPDRATAVNIAGTRNVALACRRHNAELIYVSTLAVFNGDAAEPYSEDDTPNPRSIYAKSKYEGECIVGELVERHFIVRAGWMFGGGIEDKKFVAKILDLARQRDELTVVDDKFGCPTYTVDFANAIRHISESRRFGVYHAVNTGSPVSRFDLARRIVEIAEITSCTIRPVSSDTFPLPAPRPRMEAGVNDALAAAGLPIPRPWDEALFDYITSRLTDR
ncbi:MAG: dTDP-4-dehydrorhamnose reductase [Lentisphaeria bacterium]|nr:dTDP-4-dehydrorhamnose reductase [Lentisphaeria bacterium]